MTRFMDKVMSKVDSRLLHSFHSCPSDLVGTQIFYMVHMVLHTRSIKPRVGYPGRQLREVTPGRSCDPALWIVNN